MNNTMKITAHEFKTTAANKTFVIMTIIGPFLILAMAILPSFFAQSASNISAGTRIGIVTGNDIFFQQIEMSLAQTNIVPLRISGKAAAIENIQDESIQGALILPADPYSAQSYQYLSRTGTDYLIAQTLENNLGQLVVAQRLQQAGIDPAEVTKLSMRPSIDMQKLDKSGAESEQDFTSIMVSAFGFVFLLYMTLIFYGQMIGRAVIVEKTSKTVEILLSSAKPVHILFGKILGKGAAGLLQYAIWIGMAFLLITFVGPYFGITAPRALSIVNLAYLLLFFVLAFFLYASAYAAIGSGAEDEHHLGQLAWPFLIFLIIPIMMVSGLIMNPDSTIARVLSFFPFTAPIVMFTRILVGTPPAWEILLSLGILCASILLMVYLSAKFSG